MSSGTVISINISKERGKKKVPVSETIVTELGIQGDVHAGKWHRQISLLAQESINKMRGKLSIELSPGDFAENITTSGLLLHTLPVGTHISVGEVELEVTQIGKECHDDCEIKRLVGTCVMPTEGIFTRVVKPGHIKVGDPVEAHTV